MTSKNWGAVPSGAEARSSGGFSARLKVVPFHKTVRARGFQQSVKSCSSARQFHKHALENLNPILYKEFAEAALECGCLGWLEPGYSLICEATAMWLVTLKTPGTWLARVKANWRSMSFSTTPANSTLPFSTTMRMGACGSSAYLRRPGSP